jgi:hypothetical protein
MEASMRAALPMLGLTVLAVALAASSCGSTPAEKNGHEAPAPVEKRPSWVEDHPEDPRYPRTKYLTGLGSGDGRKGEGEALKLGESQAVAEISRIVKTEISSVLDAYMQTVMTNDEFWSKDEVKERIISTTSIELRGAEVKRKWLDPETRELWVKVVISRSKYADSILSEIKADLAKIPPPSESADAAIRIRSHLQTGRALVRSMGKLANAEAVIRGGPIEAMKKSLLDRTRASFGAVADLCEQTKVTVVSGGDQVTKGAALQEKIVLRVTTEGEPLGGFPIEFTLEDGIVGQIVRDAPATSKEGIASCSVSGVLQGMRTSYSVRAWLDFLRFAPGFPRNSIPGRAVGFTFPRKGPPRFAVAIEEKNAGKAVTQRIVEGQVRELLNENSAPIVQVGITRDELADQAVKTLCKRLEGQAEYLIRGRVEAHERPKDRFYFSYAGGRVDVVYVATGDVVLTVAVEPLGTVKGSDVRQQSQAGVKALTVLAERVVTDLGTTLGPVLKK